MKCLIEVCLVASILICGASAQDSQNVVLRQGVSVQLAAAGHAVEMRAADEANATVVAITAEGKVYLGINVVVLASIPWLEVDGNRERRWNLS